MYRYKCCRYKCIEILDTDIDCIVGVYFHLFWRCVHDTCRDDILIVRLTLTLNRRYWALPRTRLYFDVRLPVCFENQNSKTVGKNSKPKNIKKDQIPSKKHKLQKHKHFRSNILTGIQLVRWKKGKKCKTFLAIYRLLLGITTIYVSIWLLVLGRV
jgi:hypothetical protein